MTAVLPTERSTDEDSLDFAAYRSAVSDAVVPLDVHCEEPMAFRGRLAAATAGDIAIFDIHADEHAVHRTPRLVSRSPARHIKFTSVTRGSGLIVQDGRETALRPGDMAVYDTDRPYSILFDAAVHMTVVMFPKSLLTMPAEPFARLTATRLDGTSGIGGMVGHFLSTLGHEVGGLDGRVTRRLYGTAVDLIQTLLESEVPAAPRGQDLLISRIHDYIDDNLSDHDLDPARIARAHFISVRQLHAVFNDQGTTVSTLIRQRRLERCYDDLVNPLNAARSVGTIALGHGFVDAAHFSRAFRAHFGVPPSSLRG